MPLSKYLVLSKVGRDDTINSDQITANTTYTLAVTQVTLNCILHNEEQAASGTSDFLATPTRAPLSAGF
jgi:hypothetical protein